MITADTINASAESENGDTASGGFSVEVRLATNEMMQGCSWNFQNCLAVKAAGQNVSWGAAGNLSTLYNKFTDFCNLGKNSLAAASLAEYVKDAYSSEELDPLGLNLYNRDTKSILNIARAEAKLDVDTELQDEDNEAELQNVKISQANEKITYNVTVGSSAGGRAQNFNYYIPIVSKDSVRDSSAMVMNKEIGLKLTGNVVITKVDSVSNSTTSKAITANEGSTSASDTNDETVQQNNIFTVYYTTDQNLTSATIQGNVNWAAASENMDYGKVTAVKIATNDNAVIGTGIPINLVWFCNMIILRMISNPWQDVQQNGVHLAVIHM